MYQNIVNYYTNYKETINFIRGEKCLLRNNITKKKINKLILTEKNNLKKNKRIYKICIIIIDDLNGGFYKIKIVGNYDFISLFDKETYAFKYNMRRLYMGRIKSI